MWVSKWLKTLSAFNFQFSGQERDIAICFARCEILWATRSVACVVLGPPECENCPRQRRFLLLRTCWRRHWWAHCGVEIRFDGPGGKLAAFSLHNYTDGGARNMWTGAVPHANVPGQAAKRDHARFKSRMQSGKHRHFNAPAETNFNKISTVAQKTFNFQLSNQERDIAICFKMRFAGGTIFWGYGGGCACLVSWRRMSARIFTEI